jgi:hypothetical protein
LNALEGVAVVILDELWYSRIVGNVEELEEEDEGRMKESAPHHDTQRNSDIKEDQSRWPGLGCPIICNDSKNSTLRLIIVILYERCRVLFDDYRVRRLDW